MHQTLARVAQSRTQKEVVQAIAASSVVCTQRSYADLLWHARKILPDFFGFEGVGILFRDRRDNNLFSIEEHEEDEDKEILKIREERKKNNELLTEEEKLDDVERQYRKRSRHLYPSALGLTGQAFQSGEIVWSNNINQMKHFLASVDNVSGTVKRVNQIAVVPIFGHHKYNDDENPKATPIAIVQLINKQNMKIDQYDLVSA